MSTAAFPSAKFDAQASGAFPRHDDVVSSPLPLDIQTNPTTEIEEGRRLASQILEGVPRMTWASGENEGVIAPYALLAIIHQTF